MEWLNYHHLLYFWAVAKEGGIAPAAELLGLAQPTISGQVRSLEESLDLKLLERVGRKLQLTDDGHIVFGYAEEIFSMGQDLMDTVKGRPRLGRPLKLRVGISDALPKLVSHRLLAPALRLDHQVQITCYGDKTERLLAELAIKRLDLVLADAPVGGSVKVRAFNHLLGECGMTFFASPKLATSARDFPLSLDNAPILLPTEAGPMRRSLERWFDSLGIRPRVVAEFDDSGLMKSFGQEGEGIFAAPSVVENEVKSQYGVKILGRTTQVMERFYAITVERRIKNSAVSAITEAAKLNLFPET